MANIVQKTIYYFARQAIYERMSQESKGLFFDRIIADHLARYNFAVPYVTNKTVLDISSGEGYGTVMLVKNAKGQQTTAPIQLYVSTSLQRICLRSKSD